MPSFDLVRYCSFYQTLTGFAPYPYQLRVAEKLLTGRNIVLRAPTGAGKTWAVVAPFLYSLTQKNALADRLLYTLPLRALATSLSNNQGCSRRVR